MTKLSRILTTAALGSVLASTALAQPKCEDPKVLRFSIIPTEETIQELNGVFSLPANVLEFYLLATRMVASIASVRGYDIKQPEIRSAILLTLIDAEADAASGIGMAAMAVAPVQSSVRSAANRLAAASVRSPAALRFITGPL